MTQPIHVDILQLTGQIAQRLGQVTEMQIFQDSVNFHQQGLFSTTIFGAVGNQARNRTFGFIDLRCTLLHPIVYKSLCSTKALYKQILSGAATAIWNDKLKDFEKSSAPEAQTGYTFFMRHYDALVLLKNDSDKRNFNIDFLTKQKEKGAHVLRYLLVMPAGLRDYIVSPDGKPEEDAVNAIYRRLIAQAQLVDPLLAAKTPDVYDNIYASLQSALSELYEHILSLLHGKNKLILGKWLTRKIFNSTRNVITAYVDQSEHINSASRLRSTETAIGLFQFLRAAAPKTLYELKNGYATKIFIEGSQMAYLTNAKTWKKEQVLGAHIQKEYDQWTSLQGLESVIANFSDHAMRHLPVMLGKGTYTLALLYNDGKYVKLLSGIEELPEDKSKEHVSAVTFAEMLYMGVAHLNREIPAFVTRYPINGYGGIYPSMMKLDTTSRYVQREELGEDWLPTGKVYPAFPIRGEEFMNGMSVHMSHMSLLGADFDGDKMSLTAVLSDEAIEEVKKTIYSTKYYMSDERKIVFSNSADVIDAVLDFMTS